MISTSSLAVLTRRAALLFALCLTLCVGLRADTPDEQYTFANGLYNEKLWGLAAENLRKFLDANPDHAQAKVAAYQLGAALYRAEGDKGEVDYAGAAAAYEKALQKYPDPKLATTARYELGDIYYNLKTYDKSVAAYTEFLKTNPAGDDAAEAQFGLGESLYELKKPAEAKAAYSAVLAKYPQSRPAPYAQRALGFLAEDANDFNAAATAYKALLANYPKSDILPESKVRLAAALQNAKRFPEAITAYRAALDDAGTAQWKADLTLGLADSLFAAKNWPEATPAYRDALALLKADDDRRATLQLRLGDSFYNAKDYAQAVSAYAPVTAEKDAALAGNALYFSGNSLYEQKKYAEAAAQYQKLLDTFPNHDKAPRAALRQGDAYAELKDTAKAAQSYKLVTAKYPKSDQAKDANDALLALVSDAASGGGDVDQLVRTLPPGSATSNVQVKLAQTAFSKGDWAKAAQLAQTALGSKPDAAAEENALYIFAAAKLRAGEAPAAAAGFRKQLASYPKGSLSPQGSLGLSWALLDDKKWTEAETAARAAVTATATAKDNLGSWSKLALGEALMGGGKWKEAATTLAPLENSSVADIASQAVYDAAISLEKQKDWPAAAARWGRYATLSKDDAKTAANANLRQGLALVQAKQQSAALAAFDRAVAADASGEAGARALNESAWLALDMKQNTDAAQRWQKLEANYPKSKYVAEAALQQGEAAFDNKDWPAAIAAYKRVTEKYPGSKDEGLAWYKLGSAQYNSSAWAEAGAAFTKAAGFTKTEVAVESSYWAGESWKRAGKTAEAKTAYAAFIQGANAATATKENKALLAAAQLGLGQSLAAAGDQAGAIAAYKAGQAQASGATARELNYALGEALLQQKNYKDAALSFLKAAPLFKEAEDQDKAKWNAAQAFETAADKTTALALYKSLTERTPATSWTPQAQEKVKALSAS